MTEISVAEAKTRLTGLIHRVEGGEVVHLTRHGKSVAVLMSESNYAAILEKWVTSRSKVRVLPAPVTPTMSMCPSVCDSGMRRSPSRPPRPCSQVAPIRNVDALRRDAAPTGDMHRPGWLMFLTMVVSRSDAQAALIFFTIPGCIPIAQRGSSPRVWSERFEIERSMPSNASSAMRRRNAWLRCPSCPSLRRPVAGESQADPVEKCAFERVDQRPAIGQDACNGIRPLTWPRGISSFPGVPASSPEKTRRRRVGLYLGEASLAHEHRSKTRTPHALHGRRSAQRTLRIAALP